MRDDLAELAAFAVVAEERSFTRAAGRLGISQSALSHSVRALEERIGVQLLARTTRSVAPTAAGSLLLKDLVPSLEQIQSSISALRRLRDSPAGRVRLVMSRTAATMVLLPKLAQFARTYPQISLDVSTVTGPLDLVAGEFDAGIILGEFIQRDMIAVRVTDDLRFAVVGSPSYFASHTIPSSPRDLDDHQCVGIRSLEGGAYRWEFQKGRKRLSVNVKGPLSIDDPVAVIQAALDGVGLGLAFEGQVQDHIDKRRLVRVLEDWCPRFRGFFMYYPSRKNQPAALTALIGALRRS